jgi:hypothetical protein
MTSHPPKKGRAAGAPRSAYRFSQGARLEMTMRWLTAAFILSSGLSAAAADNRISESATKTAS